MAFVIVPFEAYWWTSTLLALATFPALLGLFVFHVRMVYLQRVKRRKIDCSNSLVFSFVLIAISVGTLTMFTRGLIFSFSDEFECQDVMLAATILYFGVKWCLYLVLSFRLDAAFANSIYKYSRRFQYSWRTFLTSCLAAEIILFLLQSEQSNYDETEEYVPCTGLFEFPLLVLIVCVDLVACFTNLYLFVRQLSRLSKVMDDMDRGDRGDGSIFTNSGKSSSMKARFSIGSVTPRLESPRSASDNNNNNNSNNVHNEPSPRVADPVAPVDGDDAVIAVNPVSPASPASPVSAGVALEAPVPAQSPRLATPTVSQTMGSAASAASDEAERADKWRRMPSASTKKEQVGGAADVPQGVPQDVPQLPQLGTKSYVSEVGSEAEVSEIVINGCNTDVELSDAGEVSGQTTTGANALKRGKSVELSKKWSLSHVRTSSRGLTKGKKNGTRAKTFLNVVKKHVILTTVSAMSTMIAAVLVGIFGMPVAWVSLDCLLNVLSVLLMFSWNQKYFKWFCFFPCCKLEKE